MAIMIKPLSNAKNRGEWIIALGGFMLNMGAVEFATREIIAGMEGTHSSLRLNDTLAVRIAFIRKKFPRDNKDRHRSAMNTLDVARKHAEFRNIVAHSPLLISGYADGSRVINGIMNVTPKGTKSTAELISIEELKGRVTESAKVARNLLAMQEHFPVNMPAK